MDQFKKLAAEIVNVLKANSDLDEDSKVLAIQCRLFELSNDVKRECESAEVVDYTALLAPRRDNSIN